MGKAWQVKKPLELAPMQKAAEYLIGRHDFTTFREGGAPVEGASDEDAEAVRAPTCRKIVARAGAHDLGLRPAASARHLLRGGVWRRPQGVIQRCGP